MEYKTVDSILKQISTNPLFAFIVECATLLGLIIAIVVPIIQKRRKVLSVEYDTKALVKEKISEIKGLEILYEGNPIKQLAVTIIKIRNRGNVLIESNDVYKGHELRIVPGEKLTIYDATVGKQSSDTIECVSKNLNDCVEVHFQTFEKKDSVEINVFHNGDADVTFTLEGKIRECKISNFDAYSENVYRRIEPAIQWGLSFSAPVLSYLLLARFYGWLNNMGNYWSSVIIIGVLFVIVTLVLVVMKILEELIYWIIQRFIPHKK